MEIKRLDFSEFHPLDHTVWECKGYPGGRRRHLKYSWDFKWRQNLRAMTLCRLGLHDPTTAWRPEEPNKKWEICYACSKDLE